MKSILSLDDFLKKSQIHSVSEEDDEIEMVPMGAELDDEEIEIEVEDSEEKEEEEKEEEKEDEEEEKEEKEEDEEVEDAGEMAYGQLERCIDYSKMLRKRVQPGTEIEPWIAAKITKAMDYLQSVYNYLDGQDGEEEDVEEGED
jgi:uncharacterized membrane protein YdbT with pleckstrin-like domain